MPGFDDRLTRELERAARPVAPDVVRTFEDVTRRRAHRTVVRKIQIVAVVVAILAGTAGAFVLLDDRFEGNQPVDTETITPPQQQMSAWRLQWRPVIATYPVAGTGVAPDLTCAPDECDGSDLSPEGVVMLDGSRTIPFYELGPTFADASNVLSAEVALREPGDGEPEWVVTFELDADGTEAFAAATRDAASASPPQDQIAIVIDGAVVSVPTVQEPITSGAGQINASSEAEAREWADTLNAGVVGTTPSRDPVGSDLGLQFRVCRVRDLAGVDLGDGPIATAFVGGRVMDDRCPDEYEGPNILAIDLLSDGAADTWIELPRCVWCEPVGSIGSTLFILLQGGSTPEYGIYRLDETLDVAPLRMDAPGDPEWGFPAGEPVTIWTGGDEGYSYWVACTGDAQWPTFVVTQSAVPVDAAVGSPYVRHTTEFTWDFDGAFVLATSDEDLVLGDPGRPAPPSGGCAIDFDPFA